MIYSFTVTFGAKYLTSMVTSVPPYGTFCLIKNNILHQSKNYKNHFENSNFRGMWPLGHVGHVTYSFINMLFISTGIFYDKLRPQILSIGTTANATLNRTCKKFFFSLMFFSYSSSENWHNTANNFLWWRRSLPTMDRNRFFIWSKTSGW